MQRLVSIVVQFFLCVSTPALVNSEALRARQDVSLAELIPLSSWEKQFAITEGKDRGKTVPLTLERDPLIAGRWNLSFGDYAGIVMQHDADHGLVMQRLNLFKSRSYIVYEPALPILTVRVARANSVPREANFKMFDRETDKLKRAGRVTHLVKRVSPWRFDTPAGLIDGYYIDIHHRMDMPYAQLEFSLGIGCRVDDGPIFGSGQYTLTKLGIFREKKAAAAALAAASGGLFPRL
jgi:hypothetical protein